MKTSTVSVVDQTSVVDWAWAGWVGSAQSAPTIRVAARRRRRASWTQGALGAAALATWTKNRGPFKRASQDFGVAGTFNVIPFTKVALPPQATILSTKRKAHCFEYP